MKLRAGEKRSCSGPRSQRRFLSLHHVVFYVMSLMVAIPSLTRAEKNLSRRLVIAERAFQKKDFPKVLILLDRISAKHPDARRAFFLRAYALFKVGQLEQAQTLLDRHFIEHPSVQVNLLRGMVAFRRQLWNRALLHLDTVIESGKQPWANNARQLASLVQQELEASEHKRLEKIEAQRKAAAAMAYSNAINEVREHLKSGQLEHAKAPLMRAERVQPGRPLTYYYRGLIAYRSRKYKVAKQQLMAAITLAPKDDWSRYMLALTKERLGNRGQARSMLAALTDKAEDPKVRTVARIALARLTTPDRPRKGGTRVLLELGIGLDTNPSILDELPAPALDSAGLAIDIAGAVSHTFRPLAGFVSTPKLTAKERFYAVRGQGQEETAIAPQLSLARPIYSAMVIVSYHYTLVLHGHLPLLSSHTGMLEAQVPLLSWIDLVVEGAVRHSENHDPIFPHLQGFDLEGTLSLLVRRSRLSLGGGYGVVKRWSETVLTAISSSGYQRPQGSTSKNGKGLQNGQQSGSSILLEQNSSFVGHGPLLWTRFQFPWRLTLRAKASLQWRLFSKGDIQTEYGVKQQTWYEPRRDTRLVIQVELLRPLPVGLELALLFDSLDNISYTAEQGFDRNYSRRIIALALRWRWSR